MKNNLLHPRLDLFIKMLEARAKATLQKQKWEQLFA